MPTGPKNRKISAIKVHQWLSGWDKVEFSSSHHRRKPREYFYVFSLPAEELRGLCGIARRQARGVKPRAADLGIQRQHDAERSDEIRQFVEFGYPWSTLSEAKRKSTEFHDLRKPGWLPTAIVVNILGNDDQREGSVVADNDIVIVEDASGGCYIRLPYLNWSRNWKPTSVPPLEVIDGQHRLWAFEGESAAADFEVPVVAFYGLDISWQAYLFWTINIKPKRINPSLAFDLYPLLRGEDWLDRAEGHPIYRETRSQELTEALWSHPDSPWYDRINMLGERDNRWVSQSAWVRALMATVVRPWEGRGTKIGGLFGSRLREGEEVLGWSRAQQAAFLIFAWRQLFVAIHELKSGWSSELRRELKRTKEPLSSEDDPAFYGPHSLIATDQGVRGFLYVLNDLCFLAAPRLDLRGWQIESRGAASDAAAVSVAVNSLKKAAVAAFLQKLADGLCTFDWRTSTAPGISEAQRREKLVFRGSGGYKELRAQLTQHLGHRADDLGQLAERLRAVV